MKVLFAASSTVYDKEMIKEFDTLEDAFQFARNKDNIMHLIDENYSSVVETNMSNHFVVTFYTEEDKDRFNKGCEVAIEIYDTYRE